MIIFGRDRFYIDGIERILAELNQERGGEGGVPSCVYVTAGMEVQEMYSLLFTHPPAQLSVFITSERYFDSLHRLFPGLTKLCLSEKLNTEELRQALKVMSLLSEQNQSAGYLPDTFKFTDAEQQVMTLSLLGHSLEDIARIRGVSPTTVSVQRNGLMKRTGTKSLQALCSLYAAIQAKQRNTHEACHS